MGVYRVPRLFGLPTPCHGRTHPRVCNPARSSGATTFALTRTRVDQVGNVDETWIALAIFPT